MSAIPSSADLLIEDEGQCHKPQMLNWKGILTELATRRRLQHKGDELILDILDAQRNLEFKNSSVLKCQPRFAITEEEIITRIMLLYGFIACVLWPYSLLIENEMKLIS